MLLLENVKFKSIRKRKASKAVSSSRKRGKNSKKWKIPSEEKKLIRIRKPKRPLKLNKMQRMSRKGNLKVLKTLRAKIYSTTGK